MFTTDRSRHPLATLVVDDSSDTADTLAELLRLHGHAVAVACDGSGALRAVDVGVPDVIFLDLRMPGMDGFEVAERIRARCAGGKQPFLIAVTGCGTEADRLRSAQAGFDLHLVKPADPAVIVGMMERFRRLLAPSIPAGEFERLPEDPPDAGSAPRPVWSDGSGVRSETDGQEMFATRRPFRS
jgi:CheY-like chemotaxis protein